MVSPVEPAPVSAFPDEPPVDLSVWAAAARKLPIVEIPDRVDHALVVAPHPDDESLGAGGLVAELAAAGTEVTVLTVTDGEGSHPGAQGIATLRAREQRAALDALGVRSRPLRCAIPDGGVGAHGGRLTQLVAARCGPSTLVLSPWERDGHADHDAVGEAVLRAAEAAGAPVLQYFVWTWQWASPADLAGVDLRVHTLRPDVVAAKRRAIACHRSQLGEWPGVTLVTPALRRRAAWPVELYAWAHRPA